jgi:ppGpp synthetase/RelA/SpoT-type nucleotidyltranferase
VDNDLATAQHAVLDHLGPISPPLTDIVLRLLDDHVRNGRRLNATEALLDPDRRARALTLLAEMARGATMAAYADDLEALLRAHPGAGALFDPVPPAINVTATGESRKRAYESAARLREPARGIGPDPDVRGQVLLEDYAIRLRRRVQTAAEAEIRELAEELGTTSRVSARTKKSADLLDKVRRMRQGRPGRPPRSEFSVGDVVDAVGVRLTVPDMQSLEAAVGEVVRRFGTGDGGRILEIENMYAAPKATQPAYRVIPMIVAIGVDGMPYTYELQLTTERASLAADVEHNTTYKPYVVLDDEQRAAVRSALEEAAALDQLETVGQDDHE